MKQILIQSETFNEARKEIRKNKNKEIVFSGKDDDLNRKILEKESISTLLLNQKGRKDRMKQRDSGFNQVLAKIAKKKNVSIGINFDEIMASKGKNKAEILGRINQNVQLCKKNKLNMKFISSKSKHTKDKHGLGALGFVLGMSTQMVKNL